MTATYDCIATTTLSSSAVSVTFSSISGSYTDLVLIFSGSAGSGNGIAFRFNSDTGSNYSNTEMSGDGTSAGTDITASQTVGRIGSVTSGGPHNLILNIQNYSNSTTYKTTLSRSYRDGNATYAMVTLWRSTSAITSVEIRTQGGVVNFNSGSTFSLYGIKAE